MRDKDVRTRTDRGRARARATGGASVARQGRGGRRSLLRIPPEPHTPSAIVHPTHGAKTPTDWPTHV